MGNEILRNGSTHNIVARGGLVQPFGFLLELICYIPPHLLSPMHNMIPKPQDYEIKVSGIIAESVVFDGNGIYCVDIKAFGKINENVCIWKLRYKLWYYWMERTHFIGDF